MYYTTFQLNNRQLKSMNKSKIIIPNKTISEGSYNTNHLKHMRCKN